MLMTISLLENNLINTANQNGVFVKKQQDQFILKKVVTHEYSLKEYLIFDAKVAPATSRIYAEGFQMLSQTAGTFASPISIARCPDDEPPYCFNPNYNYKTCYNFICFNQENTWYLLGFTSSHHFIGKFLVYPDGRLKIYMDLAGATFKVGDEIDFENFTILKDSNRKALLDKFSKLICKNHPPLQTNQSYKGWCSWYCYYENISDKDILDNCKLLSKHQDFEYIQIDDGYQCAMGDWLDYSNKFENSLDALVDKIHKSGKKAALWVAPFIASQNSKLFKENPDLFLKDRNLNLVPSEDLTYGGWRDTPWYALDFSNPKTVDYIQSVFRYFHDVLKIKYYKLDALYWGAIEGYSYNQNFSRVDNYRRGLECILQVVGKDSLVLGCNAPMWPSLGLVHAMRVTDDIIRQQDRIISLCKEMFHRLWTNHKLWILDPDCLCLKDIKGQSASTDDYKIHLAYILLSDGILMLGDFIKDLTDPDFKKINKIIEVSRWQKDLNYEDDFSKFTLLNKKSKQKLEIYFNFDNTDKVLLLKDNAYDFFEDLKLEKNYILKAKSALVVAY